MPHDIVETAREAGSFQTLLAPVDDAGLRDTPLKIALNGGVTVNDATVIQPDVEAENGVIHVIDRVLIPAA
jgi:uncharacterized surface protein with fasciclin (FAS1) repeats